MKLKKYTYLIIPFLVVVLLQLITYFGNQWYAEVNNIQGVDYSYILLDFNNAVPFLPWTVYPYVIAYPFWAACFVYVAMRSKENMYKISTMAIVTFLICGIWYFFWQSDVEAWRLTSNLFLNNNHSTPRTDLNFTESVVMWIYNNSGPRNALPSMHTLMSWLCIIALRLDKKIPKGIQIFIWVQSIAIIVATQTIKQHYIIDSIAGLALAELAYWTLKDAKLTKMVERGFETLNTKLHLG